MKIRKIQITRLLQNVMESYNAFTTVESLDRKVEAWYDKLQYQNEEFVSKAFYYWHGAKMPTAIDILKKCFEINSSRENEHTTKHLMVCDYSKYSHDWEDECETSKFLCDNNNPKEDSRSFNDFYFDENSLVSENDKFILSRILVCRFHEKKIKSIFSKNEYQRKTFKDIVDYHISYKEKYYINDQEWYKIPSSRIIDLRDMIKDLTTKIMVQ